MLSFKAVVTQTAASRRFLQLSAFLLEKKIVPLKQLADSVSQGELLEWTKNVGDFVNVDETIAVLETDKVNMEISSPYAGVITQQLAEIGGTVSVGDNLVEIDTDGKPGASSPAAAAAVAKEAPKDTPKDTPKPVPAPAPAQTTPSKPAASTPSAVAATKTSTQTYGETRVRMTRMRMKIAERLKDAQNTNAMLTTFNEVDMSNLIQMRNAYKDAFEKKHGVRLGFMSAFLAAATHALKDQPVINAVIDGTDVVYRDSVDISVAVSSPKGLVVPVIRTTNDMNFAELEKAMNKLAAKAKNNDIALEDMAGGTFTISNGGVFGSLMSTPIINPPQSSILGMHGVFDRPVAINGKVEIRPMMYLALSYDHRLVDGREAVLFLKKIKECVEDPRRILLGL